MAFSLSDYTDFREIGRGGMGKVYMATQLSLGRTVVIKEMMTGLVADAKQVMRFENEAKSAASLSHPNVIRIYDFGADRDSFYIVMEYIDGPDLEQVLSRQDIPTLVALLIATEALKGLHYAHEQGIIHRDVKPGNILVGMNGQAKVLDFGLAHAGSTAVNLTASEAIVGTPQYMSPEQANGVEQKDVRMDVFSAGVLLFRIIAGRHPFSGNTIPALLYNITQTPEPDIREIVPTIPPRLADAIHGSLVKDPSKRLSSLRPVIDALQGYIYELGITDSVEAVHRCLTDPQAGAVIIYQRTVGYHMRVANACLEANKDDLAKAHIGQVLHFDPGNEDAGQLLKHLSGGTTILRLVQKKTPSPEAQILTRERRKRKWLPVTVAALSAVLAVLAIAAVYTGIRLFGERNPVVITTAPADTARIIDTVATPAVIDTVAVQTDSAVTDSITVAVAETTSSTHHSTQPTRPIVRAGRVALKVSPSHAVVRVAGKKIVGKGGNYNLSLPAGKHTFEIRLEGYETYRRTLRVEAGVRQLVDVTLSVPSVQVSSKGTLHIHSYPWAELFVDGRYMGNTPTGAPLELTAGKHSIVLNRAGYKSYEVMVTIKAGEHLKESIKLERLTTSSVPE